MLKNLKDLFDSLLPGPPRAPREQEEHTLQLATAVLLVEVMRADATFHAGEREAVQAALREKFGLSDDEAARLAELARTTATASTDLFSFTSRINDAFEMPQKLRMIEHMWRVAYADGRLSAHENHLMRKVADLLHIPHGAYVGAKMRAKEAAGVA